MRPLKMASLHSGAIAAVLGIMGVVPGASAQRAGGGCGVLTESVDSGGGRSTGGGWANVGVVGGIGGMASAAGLKARHGYCGQLYDVRQVVVTAGALEVNEGGATQLSGFAAADDGTFLELDPAELIWEVEEGAIAAISPSGSATAAIVYQNRGGTVCGRFAGIEGVLCITSVNVHSDDFGAYAGDGLDDLWQVTYFGEENPAAAAPGADPDGDGQANRFEAVAATLPNDRESRFRLHARRMPAQPGGCDIVFSPRLDDRDYVVEFSLNLSAGGWEPLTGFTVNDDGLERTVSDSSAAGPRKFYRARIIKP